MKKLVVAFVMLLACANTYAGSCGPTTLSSSGGYSFNLAQVPPPFGTTTPFVYVGRMTFNGSSTVTVNILEIQGSFSRPLTTVSGSYSVSSAPSCALTISFSLPSSGSFAGKTFTVNAYLDRMDTAPSVNVAYHANAVFRTNLGAAGFGSLDRGAGKF